MKVCRACLSSEDYNMVQLDESYISGYNLLTNLNISLYDGISQYMCQNCVKTLNGYLDFRDKCITTEAKLQENFLEKIKSEEYYELNEEYKGTDLSSSNIIDISNKNVVKHDDINDNSINPTSFSEPKTRKIIGLELTDIKEENSDDTSTFENCFDDVFNNFDPHYTSLNSVKTEADGFPPKRAKRRKSKRINVLTNTNDIITDLLCGLCTRTFKEKESLCIHVEEHKANDSCGMCQQKFPNWPTLCAHRIIHLPQKQRRCHVCSKASRTIIGAQHHYALAHFDGENPGLACKVCNRTYLTPLQLKKHNYSAHSQKIYICDHCQKTFNLKSRLKSHLKSHSKEKSYMCKFCDFSCKYPGGLKDHLVRKHAPVKVYCKNCGRAFQSQEKHDNHTCSSNDQIVCPICGIQITRTKRMNRHMQSHVEIGKYKCDRCPAVYKTKYSLKVHTNRHDGVRPNQCEYCPRKFFSLPVLIKHRRVHTGEKPYVCKICQKGFTGSHNLKVHMKVHGEHLVVKRNKEQTDSLT